MLVVRCPAALSWNQLISNRVSESSKKSVASSPLQRANPVIDTLGFATLLIFTVLSNCTV